MSKEAFKNNKQVFHSFLEEGNHEGARIHAMNVINNPRYSPEENKAAKAWLEKLPK